MISILSRPQSPASRHSSAIRAIWIPIAAVSLLGGYSVWNKAFPNVRPAQNSQLRLIVENQDDGLLLTWAPAWSAEHAVLTIIDGDRAEHVELDPGYARCGRIRYAPISDDVAFRLELSDGRLGKTASGWIRCRSLFSPLPAPTGIVTVRQVEPEPAPVAPVAAILSSPPAVQTAMPEPSAAPSATAAVQTPLPSPVSETESMAAAPPRPQ